jgi:hypothetical protein
MNCADVQRVLPEMDEGVRNDDFQAHVKSCPACSELISDLELISSEARQLAESEEPSPTLWFRIADELRAEGLIREPEGEPARPVLLTSRPRAAELRRWNAWWLIPVAAALIVGSVYVLKPKPAGDIARQTPIGAPQAQAPSHAKPQAAKTTAPPAKSGETQLAASQSVQEQQAEDQQFLDEVSQRAPLMKAAYENQLRSVNSYINETRAYAQQNPEDEEARRQLLEAYEQKQVLYQMALSNIQ